MENFIHPQKWNRIMNSHVPIIQFGQLSTILSFLFHLFSTTFTLTVAFGMF